VRLISILLVLLLITACAATDDTPSAATSESEEEREEVVSMTPEGEPSSTSEPTESASEASREPPDNLPASVSKWGTDWSRHTISFEELFSGGPGRDGIAPIDEPIFISQEEATEEVNDNEPIVAFEHNGEARAYPLAILMWHEIVNDEVAGQPLTVTFCPLCNTAIAFDRNVGDQLLDFGTSGLLRHSDLVMWDRQTESLWQQATGEGIVGELAGTQLTFLPASIISFSEFRAAYPEGLVLSRETGYARQYGSNPYGGYDNTNRQPFLFTGEIDSRLAAMERVVGLTVGEKARAYPFSTLAEKGVINDELNGQPAAIFYAPDTLSALDTPVIKGARAIGSAVAYNPILEGEQLTFEQREGQIVDANTGSQWDITGRAIAGPLADKQLDILPHANHFWFAFAAFFPETSIWEG
jgi:hypothetical protein